MLRHYLLLSWRLLLRSKLYSSINIIGLATGMAIAMLIGLWVWDELSFNHYHLHHERLASILSIESVNGEVSVGADAPVPLAAELRLKFPADFKDMALTAEGGHLLTSGDKKIQQWGMWAQPGFPAMLSLRLSKGSLTALKDPNSLLLGQSLATSLFGDADPINKPILLDGRTALKVGGVYEDLPQNSQFYGISYLLPWDNTANRGTTLDADWSDHHFELYVQLADHASFEKTAAKIKDITKPYLPRGFDEEIGLHPMDQWRLYDEFRNGKIVGGRISQVRLFALIGCFVLLLACINFMNLSTARSGQRAKEVGLRKTIGGQRRQLIGQFLGESLLMTILAMLLAVALMILVFPLYNRLAGKQLTIPWGNPWFWLTVFCFTGLTGLMAGSYPAFYLSHFQPVKVLSGSFRAGPAAALLRKALVVVQFTISIALAIGIIAVFRQIHYAEDRPVGYTRKGLITINMNTPELQGHYDALRHDLLASGAVENMAESSSPSTEVENSMLGFDWKGRDPNSVSIIGTLFVTYDFGKTLGWTIKEGRDFSRDFPTDSGAFILNEAAVRYTGLGVGQSIRWHGAAHPIVGVITDMVMESPYMPVQPTFFTLKTDRRIHVITIRLKPTLPLTPALAAIQSIFRKYDPDSPFEYDFTDEAYSHKFLAEEQMGNLAGFFTILAVFISCLGLFGLASFVAEQRTREIGIRKVLGATVFQLWGLLSKESLLLVSLSFGIAVPVAWVYLQDWLQAYAYRAPVAWWIFAVTGIGALVLTLSVVSVQAIRAALLNPVKSLKMQ